MKKYVSNDSFLLKVKHFWDPYKFKFRFSKTYFSLSPTDPATLGAQGTWPEMVQPVLWKTLATASPAIQFCPL